MEKLLVILGPTASGKTSFAVKLADMFKGEIISADSRQIYKGMDIGTGKDLHEYKLKNKLIPYHLIDILNPDTDYSVFQFKNDFHTIYKKLNDKNKTSILCGGTALYIDSILFNYDMSQIAPSKKMRKELEELSIEKLKDKLLSINKELYDENFHITKRRIIRTLEISNSQNGTINPCIDKSINNPLVLGMDVERETILINIKNRLLQRLENGMIEEVQGLINNGMTLDRLRYFGLEYKFIGQYIFNEISYDDMVSSLNTAINRFSKRQMTFFRRMEKWGMKIHWIKPKSIDKAIELVNNYL
mgnify:CR=1 FL=1